MIHSTPQACIDLIRRGLSSQLGFCQVALALAVSGCLSDLLEATMLFNDSSSLWLDSSSQRWAAGEGESGEVEATAGAESSSECVVCTGMGVSNNFVCMPCTALACTCVSVPRARVPSPLPASCRKGRCAAMRETDSDDST
eukprot:3941854-Rhodomonas_salina.1